jgi:hypothetical protein
MQITSDATQQSTRIKVLTVLFSGVVRSGKGVRQQPLASCPARYVTTLEREGAGQYPDRRACPLSASIGR